MNRIHILKCYAGYMTAIVTFIVYMFLMWKFTNKDILEIIVLYGAFLYVPSVALPFLIAGGDDNESE